MILENFINFMMQYISKETLDQYILYTAFFLMTIVIIYVLTLPKRRGSKGWNELIAYLCTLIIFSFLFYFYTEEIFKMDFSVLNWLKSLYLFMFMTGILFMLNAFFDNFFEFIIPKWGIEKDGDEKDDS